jgi:LysM repeat protein
MVLSVHVVLIGGMLLQGCKDTSKTETKDPSLTSTSPSDTTPPPATTPAPDTSVPAVTSTAALSNQTMATTAPQIQTMPNSANSAPPVAVLPPPAMVTAPPVASGGDYVIAQGDTLGAIAKRNSVSLRALIDANPGINPKRLQIGHKLQIPVGGATVAATTPTGSSSMGMAPLDATSDSPSYTVKSGDTLGRIARAHGTSYKKIMALNDLKTTAIRVGQKLKMPAPKPAGAETIPASASISPASASAPAPGPISSASAPTAAVAN